MATKSNLRAHATGLAINCHVRSESELIPSTHKTIDIPTQLVLSATCVTDYIIILKRKVFIMKRLLRKMVLFRGMCKKLSVFTGETTTYTYDNIMTITYFLNLRLYHFHWHWWLIDWLIEWSGFFLIIFIISCYLSI